MDLHGTEQFIRRYIAYHVHDLSLENTHTKTTIGICLNVCKKSHGNPFNSFWGIERKTTNLNLTVTQPEKVRRTPKSDSSED